MKRYVFHVNGFPGIGKSYVCEMLRTRNDIVCLDLDDIDYEVKSKMLEDPVTRDFFGRDNDLNTKQKQKWFWDIFNKKVNDIFDNKLTQNPNKHLIIVGMALNLRQTKIQVDLTIHLGVENGDDILKSIYYRFMKRETSKLKQTINAFDTVLSKLPESEYDRTWLYVYLYTHIVRQYPFIWDTYKDEYTSAMDDLVRQKRTVLTQSECVDLIVQILNGSVTIPDFLNDYKKNKNKNYLGNRLFFKRPTRHPKTTKRLKRRHKRTKRHKKKKEHKSQKN